MLKKVLDTFNFKSKIVENQRYQFIDGLKGLAVLMVLWHHALGFFHEDFHFQYFRRWVEFGHRGVPLFFIISAFTIYNSSLKRFEIDLYPNLSFYLRRAFRILPFYWLNLLYITRLNIKSLLVFWNATFLIGLIDTKAFLVPGSWSLYIEEIFYITFPILFSKIYKNLSGVFILFVFWIICRFLWLQYCLSVNISPGDEIFFHSPFQNMYLFFIGLMLAHFKITDNKKLDMSFLYDLLVLGSILAIGYADDVSIVFLLAFLIYTASFSNTLTNKVLCSKILKRFGVCCYSIYFIHSYVLISFGPYFTKHMIWLKQTITSTEISFSIFVFYVASLSLLLGMISYFLIELPSIKVGAFVIERLNSIQNDNENELADLETGKNTSDILYSNAKG